jgi:hypothetical protein
MNMRRQTPERDVQVPLRALRLIEGDLERLLQIDSAALREEAAQETQSILDSLAGKRIVAATLEAGRVVVETADGNRYFFHGLTAGV